MERVIDGLYVTALAEWLGPLQVLRDAPWLAPLASGQVVTLVGLETCEQEMDERETSFEACAYVEDESGLRWYVPLEAVRPLSEGGCDA